MFEKIEKYFLKKFKNKKKIKKIAKNKTFKDVEVQAA